MSVAIGLGVVVFLLALGALGVALWALRRIQQLQQRLVSQETTLWSLRGALSAVCSSEMIADQRHSDLERQLRQLAEQHEQVLLRDPEQAPYRHAMRLAGQGASREELIQSCGLTPGEADLFLSLNRPASGDRNA